MTTSNPYAPPESEIASVATERSFARRLSFALAATGFVTFWGDVAFLATESLSEITGGAMVVLAMAMHLVGAAIAFAAPRGRRWLPVLLNAISLAIIVGAMIYGSTREILD